jgi:phage-related protein
MESFLDILKADFAPSAVLVPFYYKAPGVDERVLFVKPLGCRYDWDQTRRMGMARVQLKAFAEDPRLYDATITSTDIPFATGGSSGFGFPLGFDFGFGASSSSDGALVTNHGNRSTPAVFTITGPADTPTIRDDTYGHSLTFAIVLETGETLVVDTQYRTVKLNGTTNRRSTLITPDWFYLQPGETFLRYNAVSGTGSTMNVQFRSAWR